MPTARESLQDAALAALADLPWSAIRMVDVASAAGLSRQTLYNEFGSKDGLARALVRREADRYLYGVERLLRERADAADRLVAVAEWTVGEARARPLLRALLTDSWGQWLPAPRPVRATAAPSGVPAQRRADAGPPGATELVALVRDRSAAALGRSHGVAAEAPAGPPFQEPRRPQGSRQPQQTQPVQQTQQLHGPHGVDQGRAELLHRCELAVRLALAHLIAPGGDSVAPLVRAAVTAVPSALLSAPGRSAQGRGGRGAAGRGPGRFSAPSPRAGAR
ncbi:TetR/AcrR family transcriptional regulator [Streptomyces sp. NPDC087850]|uniref:TetR/AcrR family transcriptional regulator n=1 Tax=unclassified Streptomyces TaxID=2593676 RepID=UPI0037F56CB0